jgi:hypothetical protein
MCDHGGLQGASQELVLVDVYPIACLEDVRRHESFRVPQLTLGDGKGGNGALIGARIDSCWCVASAACHVSRLILALIYRASFEGVAKQSYQSCHGRDQSDWFAANEGR